MGFVLLNTNLTDLLFGWVTESLISISSLMSWCFFINILSLGYWTDLFPFLLQRLKFLIDFLVLQLMYLYFLGLLKIYEFKSYSLSSRNWWYSEGISSGIFFITFVKTIGFRVRLARTWPPILLILFFRIFWPCGLSSERLLGVDVLHWSSFSLLALILQWNLKSTWYFYLCGKLCCLFSNDEYSKIIVKSYLCSFWQQWEACGSSLLRWQILNNIIVSV